ncbi:MAG: D-alanine--D-alanine ligase [Rickettsiaceae bacterium]|nr:D-alanine--D-alanine ligase [Rickettsiaceae bacterium]
MSNVNNQKYYKKRSLVEKISNSGSKHIALVYGGMSSEYEVSVISAQTFKKACLELGYQLTMIDMGADIAEVIANQVKPDIVFNSLHGTYGEDGCLPGILNILKIPYTHSGLKSSAVAFDKILTKYIAASLNIDSIGYKIITKRDNLDRDPMSRPYVIKPTSEGSSVGVEIIFEETDFNFKHYPFSFGNKIIVEEYIKGREMQVALLNGKALGALELKFVKGKKFYDYEAKYTEGFAQHIMPAVLSEDKYMELLLLSEKIYNAIGCRGLARGEFILCDKTNKFFFLEINAHPGFTDLSICPEIANYVGISLNELVQQMIESAAYDED